VIAEAMADFDAGGSDPLRDQKVESFDFAGLVDAFDAARSAAPTLNQLGAERCADPLPAGRLGQRRARWRSRLPVRQERQPDGNRRDAGNRILADPAFGNSAQALTPLVGLQIGTQRLA
jgi:hypothetical protein